MNITDEMVEVRINSLRETYNNPEVYDLLKIVVRENMTIAPMLIAQGMREAATSYRHWLTLQSARGGDFDLFILARAQEIDPK